jgi:uncharacterized membrane-anchored protein/uncharacterized membrane protein
MDAPSPLGRFWRVVAIVAAGFIGFGVILWVAANWDDFGRAGRFTVLQCLVAAALVGAWARPALRAPLGLVALLGIGGLFAYFGQTYQTGADTWQLFTLWAALALPLAIAVRHDLLWAPWALVAMTAVTLWTQTHTGHSWRVLPEDLATHAMAWLAAAAIAALTSPAAARFTGAGRWPWRVSGLLFVTAVTFTALAGLFMDEIAPQFAWGLALLVACALWFGSRRGFDVFAFSALALGLNAGLLAGLARVLFESSDADMIGKLVLMGLASAGMLAVSVQWTLRRVRSLAETQTTAGPDADADASHDAGADATSAGHRPWPLVLLTALGAWLAALPLLGALAVTVVQGNDHGVGVYLLAALLLGSACPILWAESLPIFVEQLALPLLLAGAGTLGIGLFRDLEPQTAALLLGALALAIAVLCSGGRRWLQALLGAAAACALMGALLMEDRYAYEGAGGFNWWTTLHSVLAVWLAAMWAQRRLAGNPRAMVHAIGAGWLLAMLVALALLSGRSFMAGALGDASWLAETFMRSGTPGVPHQAFAVVSVLLALAAAATLARAWPAQRHASCAGVALVVAALCGFLPTLGAALLALALTTAMRHRRLASACALAAVWIVGNFYYWLAWPLATKAVVLVAAGALLAGLARWSQRKAHTPAAPVPDALSLSASTWLRAGPWLAACGIATLAIANVGIWQNQQLIARGQAVYFALAPVDPRSLMQGDFMRLTFTLPSGTDVDDLAASSAGRPLAIGLRDVRGVAVLQRLAKLNEVPAPGEMRIALTRKDGRWVLVTDAWFFREGEAERFALARFGEFRVDDAGHALLVGLADGELRPIR